MKLPFVSREKLDAERQRLRADGQAMAVRHAEDLARVAEFAEKRIAELSRLHAERVADLEKRVTSLEDERRRLLNFNSRLTTGRVIYDEHTGAELRPAPAEPKTEQQQRLDEVREAAEATGSQNPRVIAHYIERKRHTEFAAKQELRQKAEELAAIDRAIRDFEEAEQKGRKQAAQEAQSEAKTA